MTRRTIIGPCSNSPLTLFQHLLSSVLCTRVYPLISRDQLMRPPHGSSHTEKSHLSHTCAFDIIKCLSVSEGTSWRPLFFFVWFNIFFDFFCFFSCSLIFFLPVFFFLLAYLFICFVFFTFGHAKGASRSVATLDTNQSFRVCKVTK